MGNHDHGDKDSKESDGDGFKKREEKQGKDSPCLEKKVER